MSEPNFYAADNDCGTSTSTGWSNTWYVVGFHTREARTRYLRKSRRISARAIEPSQIVQYGGLALIETDDGAGWIKV